MNNAQREPSMEEILASIRRIIEDSDSTQPAGSEAAAGVAEGEAADTEADALHARAAQEPPAEERTEARAVIHPLRTAGLAESETRAFGAATAPATTAPATSRQPLAAADEMIAELGRDPASVPAPAEATASSSLAPIVSERTERQVAAAFGELSEAFAVSRRRSFDEIAEEMIRPMLRDWLDNNLPMLVERLVREEIERVARGGQG